MRHEDPGRSCAEVLRWRAMERDLDRVGAELVRIARRAIAGRLDGRDVPPDLAAAPAVLREPGASFVTLERQGRLRGCIGSLVPRRPLAVDVHANAIAAAFSDPRFPPLTREEWLDTTVEVSVLTEPKPLSFHGSADLRRRIGPGMGLVLEHPDGRATLLPQVWEQISDTEEFLAVLARKAGLSPEVYADPRTRVRVYRVVAFDEEERPAGGPER